MKAVTRTLLPGVLILLLLPACQKQVVTNTPPIFERPVMPQFEAMKSPPDSDNFKPLESRLNKVEEKLASLDASRISVDIDSNRSPQKSPNTNLAQILPEPDNLNTSSVADPKETPPAKPVEAPKPPINIELVAPPPPAVAAVAVPTPKPAPQEEPGKPVAEKASEPVAPPKVEAFSAPAQELRNRAKVIFKKLISEFSGTPEAQNAILGLGAMAEEEQAWDEAIEQYNQIMNKAPTSPAAAQACLGLARSLSGSGKYKEGHSIFMNFADHFPKDPSVGTALLSAAECRVKAGETDEALKEFRDVFRSKPGQHVSDQAMRRIAELLFEQQKYPEAVKAFSEALASIGGDLPLSNEPEKISLRSGLIRAQIAAGMKDAARAKLKELLVETTPPAARAEARIQFAKLLESEMKPLEAAWTYAQAIEDNPKDPRVPESRLRAAQNFSKAGLAEHAQEHLQALSRSFADLPAAERNRLEPEALFAAARAHREDVDIEHARAPLTELRSKYPDHPLAAEADNEESEILFNAGMREKALSLLQDVVKHHPDTERASAARLRLVQLYELTPSRNQKIPLLQVLEQKTEAGAEKANLALRHALLLQEAGRDDEALRMLSTLAESKETPALEAALAHYAKATLFQRTGKLREASGAYESFVKGIPEKDPTGQARVAALLQNAKWTLSKINWLTSLKGPSEVSIKR